MNDDLNYCSQLRDTGYWGNRISREIEFAQFLCSINPSLSLDVLKEVASEIVSFHKDQGSITKENVKEAEKKLTCFTNEAKTFTIDCVGHAHIDMNWMWGLDETISIVLDTFRTMLILMDEYPEFTFAQSQAATYHIVEQYEPEMLNEIRKRVKEGRWEVTASAWTEFDKNMASGESHLQQYKVASEYICKLLELEKDQLCVGFEPDTFGHNARLPDILSISGIKYYYHCRGEVDHTLYRWIGPQGGQVLVFREPSWYLGPSVTPLDDPSKGTLKALEMDMASEVARFYQSTGIRRMLQVYGVGDHGGGPTRLDIEGLTDIATWPCYPSVIFSTIKNFFSEVHQYIDTLPVVTGEINSIFPGCYTSQSLIKKGNHESEKMLYEAHFYESSTAFYSGNSLSNDHSDSLKEAWKDLFFNQFHDILPGSCTPASKSYALGLYQTIYGRVNSARTSAIRNLAQNIDTSSIHIPVTTGKRAFGAGVGYKNSSFKVSPVGGIEGTKRIVTLFNSTSLYRNEVVSVVLWDWENTSKEIACCDDQGNDVVVVTHKDQVIYWQHSALILDIPVTIPPCGHSSYIFFSTDTLTPRTDCSAMNPRVQKPHVYVLDNGVIKATFSSQTLELVSLINVEMNEELLSQPSGLNLLDEDAVEGMSAWIVGREGPSSNKDFIVKDATIEKNPLYQKLTFHISIRSSDINMSYRVDACSNIIQCESSIVWRELGDEKYTPQLSFALHLKGSRKHYLYDIPFGTILREASPMHVPSLSWASGKVGNSVIQLIGRGKYGYCCTQDTMKVILLRSSSEPDRFPEVGEMEQNFSIVVHSKETSNKQLIESSLLTCHDVQQVTHGQHEGVLPLNISYIQVDGDFVVTSINLTSLKDSIEMRGYETEGKGGIVTLSIPILTKSYLIEIIRNNGEIVSKGSISSCESYSFQVVPYGIYSMIISLD